jgi:prolyl oligopeptidase
MKFRAMCSLAWLPVATATWIAAANATATAQLPAPPSYPASARTAAVDDVGGVQVADPYRWLESGTSASSELRAWTAAQTGITASYLAQLPPRRAIGDLVARLTAHAKVSAPIVAGERMFYLENAGLDNQAALYVRDRATAVPRALVDPNLFSPEGIYAIVGLAPSPDGRYVAYAVSTQGSPWHELRVRDVRAAHDEPEELHELRDGPISWTKDNRGFFYVRTDSIRVDKRQRVFYHRLGKRQVDDQVVYENLEHPDWRVRAAISEDGQYLVIALNPPGESRNRLYFVDLDNPGRPNLRAPLVRLFDDGDASYDFVSSAGAVFYVLTDKDAPRNRLVAVDINAPDENHWTNVVRETYDPLIGAVRVDDRVVAHRLHDAHSVLELYSLTGAARGGISIPTVGTVTRLSPHSEGRELYFEVSSFLQPTTVFRYDLDTRNVVPLREVRPDSSLAAFETTQLFYTSKDGTRVPMFITARRGITLDGSHPALLSGYGSFGIPNTPAYSPLVAAWLARGGIYAVANVRGGGEYGRAWHDAATGARKQVAIDDLLAAAEFLVGQRYTRPAALGVIGSGAGGLLAAAAVVQRPEAFGAASIDNALLDMVRYARFGQGADWREEFGAPDRASDLRGLLSYSPVQNVRTGRYPPVLVSVSDNDAVIPPFHGYKLTAELQAAQTAPAPVLLRVDPSSGHGAAMPTSRRIALDADRVAFLVAALHAR